MTYKEAIETIKIAIAEVEWNYPMDYAIAFDKAIEALEKMMWIPVSERLPDNNGTYLITVSSYDETASIEYITVDHGNSDGGFLHFETKKNPKAKSGKVVTAWMPAPEPYKEGE